MQPNLYLMNRRLWHLSLLLLCAVLCQIANLATAQQLSIHKYKLSEGLPQMQVMLVMQDSRGYIWILTKKGLSKFDGVHFVNHYRKDGLPSDHIIDICEDRDGQLWAIAANGLAVNSGHGFETILTPSELNFVRFSLVETLSNGNLLIQAMEAGDNWGVYEIDPRKKRIERRLLNESYDFKKSTSDGHIYIRSTDAKMYRWQPEGLQLLADSIEVGFSRPLNHILWHDNNQYATITEDTILLEPYQSRRVDYIDHPVWGHLKNDSLFIYSLHTYTAIPWKNGWVNGIFTDRDGMHYIYGEDGFYKVVSNAFQNFDTEYPGVNRNIWSVIEDKQGRIWFTSLLGTIQIWDGQNLTDFDYEEDLGHARFYMGSTRLANGELLITHGKGVYKYNERGMSVVDWVKGQTQLAWQNPKNGHLLVSDCSQGLLIHRGDKLDIYPEFNDNELGFVIDACLDKSGVYWYATEEKIVRQKGDSLMLFEEGLVPLAHSKAVACDSTNRVWIGGNEGLFWFNRQAGTFVPALPPDFNESVQFIHVMNDSALLVGRYGNILMLDLYSFDRKILASGEDTGMKPWKVFGEEEGFFGGETEEKGILKDRHGYYWIIGSEGVVRFNPAMIKKNHLPPLLHVTGITGYNSLTREQKSILIPSNEKVTDNYRFPHALKNIRVNFDAISTRFPKKLTVQYRINGEEWVPHPAHHPLVLSGLLPGNYLLEIRAGNEDYVFSQPVGIAFRMVPAFWQSTWFRILAVLAVTVIIYQAVQYRTRRKIKKEQQRQKYMNEINNLRIKSLQSQMNPHFVSNALNSIQYFVLKNDLEASVKYIQDFGRLLRLTLNTLSVDAHLLADEINYLESYITVENNRLENKIEYHFLIESGISPKEISVPVMLIQPYVENFFKHGISGEEIQKPVLMIRFVKIMEGLRVEVEDNGPGFMATVNNKSEHNGHQSHATRITGERIATYNEGKKEIYNVKMTDLGEKLNKAGTLVTIIIPATINKTQKNAESGVLVSQRD